MKVRYLILIYVKRKKRLLKWFDSRVPQNQERQRPQQFKTIKKKKKEKLKQSKTKQNKTGKIHTKNHQPTNQPTNLPTEQTDMKFPSFQVSVQDGIEAFEKANRRSAQSPNSLFFILSAPFSTAPSLWPILLQTYIHHPSLSVTAVWPCRLSSCSFFFFFFFFLRCPAISLGFTTLGEIFAYVTVFLHVVQLLS